MAVLKLGGSCLREAEDYAAIPGRARAEGARVVVLSALAGVTDALVALADGASPRHRMGERHRALVAGLPDAIRTACESELAALVRELDERLARSAAPDLDAWERDAILGTGERLSLVVAAAHVRAAGVPVRMHVARDAGVVTSPEPGRARVLPEGFERARTRLAASAPGLDLVAGYVGRTVDGRWTTLGRGGSDVTAAFLGAALGLPVLLLKDAPGVLTADPLLVPGARTVARLSPLHALGLARAGSGVVAAAALELALEHGVTLEVRPWRGGRGTRIEPTSGGGRALAWSSEVGGRVRVTLLGTGAPGLVSQVAARLPGGVLEPLPDGLAVTLPAADLARALGSLEPLCDPGSTPA